MRRYFWWVLLVFVGYSFWSFVFYPWYFSLDSGVASKGSEGSLLLLSERSAVEDRVDGGLKEQDEFSLKKNISEEGVSQVGVKANSAIDDVGKLAKSLSVDGVSSDVCRKVKGFFTQAAATQFVSRFEELGAAAVVSQKVLGVTKTFWLAIPQGLGREDLQLLDAVLVRNGLVMVLAKEPALEGRQVVGPFLSQVIADGYLKKVGAVVAGAVVEEVDFEQMEYSLKVSRVDEGAFEVVFEEMSSLNQNLTQVACN